MKFSLFLAFASLASVCLGADIKPFDAKVGLWETISTIEIEGMPSNMQMPQIPPEKLAQLPPAQRAKMEEMMKNRTNINGPHTSRSCATRESLNRGMGMGESKEANCTRQVVSSSTSRSEIHVECTPAGATGAKSVGDMVMERVDAEHLKGNMKMKTMQSDKTINMAITFTSKWISADCGDIKPGTAR